MNLAVPNEKAIKTFNNAIIFFSLLMSDNFIKSKCSINKWARNICTQLNALFEASICLNE